MRRAHTGDNGYNARRSQGWKEKKITKFIMHVPLAVSKVILIRSVLRGLLSCIGGSYACIQHTGNTITILRPFKPTALMLYCLGVWLMRTFSLRCVEEWRSCVFAQGHRSRVVRVLYLWWVTTVLSTQTVNGVDLSTTASHLPLRNTRNTKEE